MQYNIYRYNNTGTPIHMFNIIAASPYNAFDALRQIAYTYQELGFITITDGIATRYKLEVFKNATSKKVLFEIVAIEQEQPEIKVIEQN